MHIVDQTVKRAMCTQFSQQKVLTVASPVKYSVNYIAYVPALKQFYQML